MYATNPVKEDYDYSTHYDYNRDTYADDEDYGDGDDNYDYYDPDGYDPGEYVNVCELPNGAAISGCSHDDFYKNVSRLTVNESNLCCSRHHGYIYQNSCEVNIVY